jgi:hypothetical protein
MKAMVTRTRSKDTDVVDVWRCLEILVVAGASRADFATGEPARAAGAVRTMFSRRHGPAMQDLAAALRLSQLVADQRFTRIRAMIDRVLGSG